MLKTTPLQKIITITKNAGYTIDKIFSKGSTVKYIQCLSILQRKAFILKIADSTLVYSTECNYILQDDDSNYKNYNQREFLDKVNLPSVACISEDNLCIKNNKIRPNKKKNATMYNDYDCFILLCDSPWRASVSASYNCDSPWRASVSASYNCDSPWRASVSASEPNTLDEKTIENIENVVDIENVIDIENVVDIIVDEYPIDDIVPVYDISVFLQQIMSFENIISKDYSIINSLEEDLNEKNVENLLLLFDTQKIYIKNTIYDIHKDIYNINRDIVDYSLKLQRINVLKEKSVNEKDKTRFQIERLSDETIFKLDSLNEQLKQKRIIANNLLKNYNNYILTFKN